MPGDDHDAGMEMEAMTESAPLRVRCTSHLQTGQDGMGPTVVAMPGDKYHIHQPPSVAGGGMNTADRPHTKKKKPSSKARAARRLAPRVTLNK